MEVQYVLNEKKLSTFLRNVRQEILNIQSGEAKWRSGPALHFEVNKAVPVIATLDRFQENPTKKNYDAFIAQASQDLGKPTGDGFAQWGSGLWHTVTHDGDPVVADKTFAAAIKDGFYDCFKVARISMDQKQVERLEAVSKRMAASIGVQIANTVKAQLEVLVERLKKDEAKKAKSDAE